MKVGDLVKIDYSDWKLSAEFLSLYGREFCGVVVQKLTRKFDATEYVTIATTDGKHRTFPCDPDLPPNISVVSARDH